MDQCWQHTPDSVMVSWLPAFHDMGLIYGMLQPLFGGFRCCFMPPAVFFQQPLRWLEAISHYRGTHSAAPNFAYDLCVQSAKPQQLDLLDLSSWEFAINGAKTSSGKIQRHACRQGFLDGSLKALSQWRGGLAAAGVDGLMDYADAAFFGVDSKATPQVIAAVCDLDRQPDMQAIVTQLSQALDRFPRLRQRVVREPTLAWVTDTGFTLARHTEFIRHDSIRSRDDLLTEVRRWISSAPSLEHPPWQVVVITNGTDQSCLVLRAHHAFCDGVRLMRLLEAISSRSGDAQRPIHVVPDEIQSRPAKSVLQTVRHAARYSRKLLAERLVRCGASALNGTTSSRRT